MAIVIESSTDITEASDVDTFDVTKPTGLATDDLLLAIIAKDDNVPSVPPAGWSTPSDIDGTDVNVCIHYKVAVSADASATGFTFTGDNEQYVGRLYRISGVLTSSPTDATDATGANGASSGTVTANAITNTYTNSLVFAAWAFDDDDDTKTYSGTWTEDLIAKSNTGNGTASVIIARKDQAGTGTTGDTTATQPTSEAWSGVQISIRDATTAPSFIVAWGMGNNTLL